MIWTNKINGLKSIIVNKKLKLKEGEREKKWEEMKTTDLKILWTIIFPIPNPRNEGATWEESLNHIYHIITITIT